MLKPTKFFYQWLLFLSIASIGVACKDEAVEPVNNTPTVDPKANPYEVTNNWIHDVMKQLYLWNTEMPANPDKTQTPEAFYGSLKSTKDRFSHIVPDYEALMKSLQGVTLDAGYEFSLAPANGSTTDVWAFVTYIKPNSPAEQTVLKRGDIITHIDNQIITRENYRSLLAKLSSTHTITYQRYNANTQSLEAQPALQLTPVELAENPHFMNKVITTASGKKVGYYVYNFFSAGSSNTYDNQMAQIISDFKSHGVNELVLDLRYNSGGSVSSATNLGSLIGKNVDNTKTFIKYRYNTGVQDYYSKNDPGRLAGKFVNKSENIGNNLASGTVYVLVSRSTASASELIINGLKPYMNVVLIGSKTTGKNVGSWVINDTKNPENKYGIMPIVFQFYNSLDQSDFAAGFEPDFKEFDLALQMKPLGDVNELMLAKALSLIDGSATARKSGSAANLEETQNKKFVPIGSSFERKPWSNTSIVDEMPAGELNPF